MSDMHDLLERKARAFRPDDDGLEHLLRRADRRHRRRRITSAAVALAVAAVGSLGAYSMLNDRPTSGGVSDGGAGGSYHAIWPHPDYEVAMSIQARANAGDNAVAWEQQANEVIAKFALEGLGWVNVWVDPLPPAEVAGNGPATQAIRGCRADEVNSESDVLYCPDDKLKDGMVTIERLLQRNADGIWSVTEATVEGQPVDVEPAPVPEEGDLEEPPVHDLASEIRDVVGQFADARRARSDEAWDYLSDAARTAFETNEGGLQLFGYASAADSGRSFDADRIADTNEWRVALRFHGPDGVIAEETLRVGLAEDGAPVLILEARRTK